MNAEAWIDKKAAIGNLVVTYATARWVRSKGWQGCSVRRVPAHAASRSRSCLSPPSYQNPNLCTFVTRPCFVRYGATCATLSRELRFKQCLNTAHEYSGPVYMLFTRTSFSHFTRHVSRPYSQAVLICVPNPCRVYETDSGLYRQTPNE